MRPPLRAFYTMTCPRNLKQPIMVSIHAPGSRAVYIHPYETSRRSSSEFGADSKECEVQRQEMELKARCLCFVMMLLVAGFAGLETAHGAGECGRVPVDQVALKLAPCAVATQNPRGAVPPSCCLQVRSIGQNPKCLCAVMLSDTARRAGVKPAVAMTIPKRCAIANRPIGYKCGPYTLP